MDSYAPPSSSAVGNAASAIAPAARCLMIFVDESAPMQCRRWRAIADGPTPNALATSRLGEPLSSIVVIAVSFGWPQMLQERPLDMRQL
jgi:hypothetical protein